MTHRAISWAAWLLNRYLYGAHTANAVWSIDRRLGRVERIEGVRMPY
jgi:hypothetical protein